VRRLRIPSLLLFPVLAVALALSETAPSATTSSLPACKVVTSRQLGGSPAEVILGRDGRLWFTELIESQIGALDPATGNLQEFALPPGTNPHGMREGPDGDFYFAGLHDQIGQLNPRTGSVQLITAGISKGGQTQHLAFPPSDPNHAYVSEYVGGRLIRMDLHTHQITEITAGLPPNNNLHYMVIGNDGQIWATLQGADELARFNVQTQTFDRFAKFPHNSQPHILRLSTDNKLFVSLQKASQLGEYDPQTGTVQTFQTDLPRPASTSLFSPDPRLVDMQPTPSGRSVWISTESATLYRFDRASHKITGCHMTGTPFIGTTPAPPGPTTPLTFTVDRNGHVWASDLEARRLIRLPDE
jgi:streptogramin lyase